MQILSCRNHAVHSWPHGAVGLNVLLQLRRVIAEVLAVEVLDFAFGDPAEDEVPNEVEDGRHGDVVAEDDFAVVVPDAVEAEGLFPDWNACEEQRRGLSKH